MNKNRANPTTNHIGTCPVKTVYPLPRECNRSNTDAILTQALNLSNLYNFSSQRVQVSANNAAIFKPTTQA